jgi:hypothetical protein
LALIVQIPARKIVTVRLEIWQAADVVGSTVYVIANPLVVVSEAESVKAASPKVLSLIVLNVIVWFCFWLEEFVTT